MLLLFTNHSVAQQVVCKTSPHMQGPASITVIVRRDGDRDHSTFTADFEEGVSSEFLFDVPEFHGISPSYGPRSGGTLVALTGTALNIGNTSLASVRLASKTCIVQ